MASKKAHQGSGAAAGTLAAAIIISAGADGPYGVLAVIALLAGFLGGTAPDWMEVAWWRRKKKRGAGRLWITHRTVTHWGIPWVTLLYYSYMSLNHVWWAPVTFGFAAGGVMHLLADWPNPMGVPWIFRRHSLGMWRSGNFEVMVIVLAWCFCAFFADEFLLGGKNTAKLIEFTASYLPSASSVFLSIQNAKFLFL